MDCLSESLIIETMIISLATQNPLYRQRMGLQWATGHSYTFNGRFKCQSVRHVVLDYRILPLRVVVVIYTLTGLIT